MLDFVALDFEFGLHMSDRISIVEIGMQKVVGGKLVDNWQTLVNPESKLDGYASDNIHHIYASDVLFAATFATIWPQIISFVGDLPLVVHGVKNEQHAIITNCRFYDLPLQAFKYIDTLTLAKKLLPDLPKYNVNYLADYFKLPMTADHAALDDAQLTAQVLVAMQTKYGTDVISKIIN